MKCHVFKPSRRDKESGKTIYARIWSGRFRLAGDPKDTTVALGVTDKAVAEAKLKKIVRELEQERAGVIPPKIIREGMKSPLVELINEFVSERENQRRNSKYCLGLRRQLELLAKRCDWKNLSMVTADSFRQWRRSQKRSAKTLNEYLTSANSFMNWLMKDERIGRNPLISVQRIERREESKYRRRALTDEEARRLIATAGEWSHLYWLAIETGLRRGELSRLEWRDFALEHGKAFVNARASITKNGRGDHQPISNELAAHLLQLRPDPFNPFAKVFGKLPLMDRVREDFKKAGIQPIDKEGRIADFHGFRHTTGTRLALSGAPLSVAMKAMRHSDPKLTTKIYAHVGQSTTRETMLALPSLAPVPTPCAPIRALELVPSCHTLSPEDTAEAGFYILQATDNQLISHSVSLAVTSSHNWEDGARCRVRTCDISRGERGDVSKLFTAMKAAFRYLGQQIRASLSWTGWTGWTDLFKALDLYHLRATTAPSRGCLITL